jgi:hypothetical protein
LSSSKRRQWKRHSRQLRDTFHGKIDSSSGESFLFFWFNNKRRENKNKSIDDTNDDYELPELRKSILWLDSLKLSSDDVLLRQKEFVSLNIHSIFSLLAIDKISIFAYLMMMLRFYRDLVAICSIHVQLYDFDSVMELWTEVEHKSDMIRISDFFLFFLSLFRILGEASMKFYYSSIMVHTYGT